MTSASASSSTRQGMCVARRSAVTIVANGCALTMGDAAPDGPILGVRVEHLGAKEALLSGEPDVCFTTPHFDGYPAVLVKLDRVALDVLEELIVEAWLARAPKRLADAYVAER